MHKKNHPFMSLVAVFKSPSAKTVLSVFRRTAELLVYLSYNNVDKLLQLVLHIYIVIVCKCTGIV